MPGSTIDLLNNGYFLFFGKVAVLILLIFYAIFSLLIVRQVDLMGKTLSTPIGSLVKIIAIIHAFVALGLIFLALLIL